MPSDVSSTPTAPRTEDDALPRPHVKQQPWLHRLGWMCFALLCVFPLFFSLGNHPIHGDSEARYGVVARGMATGQAPLLIPTYFDQPHLTKPPLTYWLMAGSIRVLGDGEFALRLPAALSGVLTLVIVFGLAHRLYGTRRAAIAAAIVSVTPMFVVVSRMGITDGPLGLFCTAALASGLLAVREGRRRWVFGLWAAVALALLTKGPAGLLPPGALVLWLLITRQHAELRRLRPAAGLAAALLPLTAWGLWVVRQHPEAWGIWRFQTLDRATGAGDHPEPWWFFIPVFIVGLLPATALLWSRKPSWNQLQTTTVNAIHSRRESLLWAMMAALTFAIFTLITGKLMSYLMPLAAPLAWWAAGLFGVKHHSIMRLSFYKVCFISVLYFALLAALLLFVYRFSPSLAWMIWPAGLPPLMLLACLAWRLPSIAKPSPRLLAAAWLVSLNVIGWACVAEDRVYRMASVPALVAQVREATGLSQPHILTVGFVERSLPYYTGRPTERIDPRVLDEVWATMRKDDLVLLADPVQWDIFDADPNWDLSQRFMQLNIYPTLGYTAQPLRVYRTTPHLFAPPPDTSHQQPPDGRPRDTSH